MWVVDNGNYCNDDDDYNDDDDDDGSLNLYHQKYKPIPFISRFL